MKFGSKRYLPIEFSVLIIRLVIIVICCGVFATANTVAVKTNEIETTLTEANNLKRSDKYEQALKSYQKAELQAEQQKNKLLLAKVLLGEGEVYYLQTKFVHAVSALRKSIDLSEKVGDLTTQAWANNWLGYVYYRLYYYDSSQFHLTKSLKQFEQLHNLGGQAIVSSNLARMLDAYIPFVLLTDQIEDLANWQISKNDNLKYYLQSISLARESGDKEALSYALNNYANNVFGYDKSKAIEMFQEAYQLAKELGLKRRMIITLGNIGRSQVYLGLKCLWAGDKCFLSEESKKYLEIGQQSLEEAIQMAEEIGTDEELFELYTNLANSYPTTANTAPDNLDKSIDNYKKAIAIVERMRRNDDGDELSKIRYFNARTEPYTGLINSLIDVDKLGSLNTSEQSNAQAFLALRRQNKIAQNALFVSAQAQSNILKLQDELTSLNREKLNEEKQTKPNKIVVDNLEKQINRIQQQKLDAQAEITSKFKTSTPSLEPSQPITMKDLEDLVPDEQTAIIVYESLHTIMVITREKGNQSGGKTKLILQSYGPDYSESDQAARSSGKPLMEISFFRQQLEKENSDYKITAKKLYKRYFAPFAESLKDKSKLIIVPDNIYLWNLPFDALVSPQNRHLIEDFSISYAPSLTALREMKKLRLQKAPKDFKEGILAIGDPIFGNKTVDLAKKRFRNADITQLPETKREVNQIAGFYKNGQSKIVTEKAATEDLIKREAGNYRILHIATHGFVNRSNSLFSALILSKTDGSDGLLEAWEIMQMKLNADIVVLSACETANGRTFFGEGLTGLTWAFMISGVSTTVATQWKVDSDATADLMIEFHRQLTQYKLSPAEALRKAQLKLMQNDATKHPFYWASFVVVGLN